MVEEVTLGHLLQHAVGGGESSPGAHTVQPFEQKYDDEGWPLNGITIERIALKDRVNANAEVLGFVCMLRERTDRVRRAEARRADR